MHREAKCPVEVSFELKEIPVKVPECDSFVLLCFNTHFCSFVTAICGRQLFQAKKEHDASSKQNPSNNS